MRIAVSGGGTVGHVSPVLAAVDALRASDKQLQVLYIGARGGMEAGPVRAAGLPYAGIWGGKIRRLPGAGLWRNLAEWRNLVWNLRDLLLIVCGTVQSLVILVRFHPDVLFNKAGTTGFPVGIAARLLRIPMVILEPDLTPGLTNRTLSRWATAVAVGFPVGHYRQFPRQKLRFTGSPVQPAMLAGTAADAVKRFGLDPKRPVIVVVGGSQGAAAVNRAVAAILPQLTASAQVVQVTGRGNLAEVQADAARQGMGAAQGYHAVDFVTPAELGSLYRAATIVVTRGGANTITELAALAKPIIVLPNHQAAAHQVQNARELEAARAAIVLPREEPQPLLEAITRLLDDAALRRRLARQLAAFYQPDAAQRLAEVITQAAGTSATEAGRQ